jgi:magnesium-transporting ATPase (P-type)
VRPEEIANVAWHAQTLEDALALLAANEDGLCEREASERRAVFGPNRLPKQRRPGLPIIYLRQFKSPLIYLLLAAAAISLVIGEATDAIFIFAVLQINALIGMVQKARAESSAEALGGLIRQRVMLLRNGHAYEVDGELLVPGDVVQLRSGSLVSADLRLLSARNLKVDESLLTGESMPVEKHSTAALDEHTVLGDRTTMLHAGTTVLHGRAVGLVVRIGKETEVGRIAQALDRAAPPPLVIRLERFTRIVGTLVVLAVTVLAVALLLRGMEPAQVFFLAVALAVSAIPEGLPVAITVALSVAAARMARRNVIVRSLPAVEGLGTCTVIASDKTGTLTCNELTVTRVWLPGVGDLLVEGRGYAPEGAITRDGAPPGDAIHELLHRLAVAGALANEATLRREGRALMHFGDTVDVAMLAFAGKLHIDRAALSKRFPEVDIIPFESANQFSASINRAGEGLRLHAKGAAERILPMCAGVDREAALTEVERLAAEGFRVIAVAGGQLDTWEDADGLADFNDLDFLGLCGLMDPLRAEVADAVARCTRAGVEVRMVTGDHPVTALAIARELGLDSDSRRVVRGLDLEALAPTPADLDRAIENASVFARVEPIQKLSIVESLRRRGHFVAVTGDGVNDAPALRAANIGVAMGMRGTDVAREAADLILTDDDFSSIVNGVEEGRIAYDNVRKVVYLLVSTGAAEIVLFLLAFVAGLPLPLYAAQLLWLNLVTNGIQDVALAFEKGEPHVLDQPPRRPSERIFDGRMIQQVLVSGTFIGVVGFLFFDWALAHGWSEDEARNALLLLIVCFENAHIFNCRSEWRSAFRCPFSANPFLIIAVLCSQGVHIAAMWMPGLSGVLHVEPVSLATWFGVAGIAAALIAVMEIFKWALPRRVKGVQQSNL